MGRSEIFNFKKFKVVHRINAQKVSTDSVLLGAWADFSDSNSILDIGTGCGLLSLMAAQKTDSKTTIEAVEIDENFAIEADENFKASQWADKINLSVIDVKNSKKGVFDHIICNPPYFKENIYSPSDEKNRARHDLDLTFDELASIARKKLKAEGKISLVGPADLENEIISTFQKETFFLKRLCQIKHHASDEPSLLLFEFRLKESISVKEELFIRNLDESYSDQYAFLLKDFLTIF